MENGKVTTTIQYKTIQYSTVFKGLKSGAVVLFLSVAGMLIQCFVYSPDLAAQTDRRQTVSRDRYGPERVFLRLAQSQSAPKNRGFDNLRDALHDDFGGSSQKMSKTAVAFFFLAVLLLAAGLIYYDTVYLKQRKKLENPWVVFRELCKAHRLRRHEKTFLQRAADGLGLDNPLPLFIEPKFLMSLLENNNFREDRMAVVKLLHVFFGIEP